MNSLELRQVRFCYSPAVEPLHQVDLTVTKGERIAVLGESGTGKSSLLRLVAGLEKVSGGEIWIDGEMMSSDSCHVAPEKRKVGMVFQDWAVFPHLSVFANVAFGLECRGRSKAGRERILRLMNDFELSSLVDRAPATLSGGQLQRVACARALAPSPRLLLLDEAFSSLDLSLRQRVRHLVLETLSKEKVTCVIVTHDPSEAFACADRVFQLKDGRLFQVNQ